MKISIVITAWNLENFIEQALHSCRQEGAGDLEILVVDNGSTDRTVELVYRFADGLDRGIKVSVLSHDANKGPGEARNTGLAAATGDYVVFLDGDDWFQEGALLDVRNALELQRPDILIYGFQRVYPDGEVGSDTQKKWLYPRDNYLVKDREELMKCFSVAWNKAYNRAYLRRHGFRFADGLYEDISWSFSNMLLAKSIATLPISVTAYRQREQSITHSTGKEHYAVFDEYRRVFEILQADRSLCQNYGRTIYHYARTQMITIRERGRVPKELVPDYITTMFSELEKFRRILNEHDVDLTHRDRALRAYRLAGTIGFRGFMALRKIRSNLLATAKRTSSRVSRALKHPTSAAKGTFAKIYSRVAVRRPLVKKKVFFESYWGTKADCNPLAIAQALDGQGGFDIVWCFDRDASIPDGFPWRTVERGSIAMLKEACTAGYLVSNTNLHGYIPKRHNAVHLQTWHGTPLKLMGIDIRAKISNELNWKNFVQHSNRWDFVVSSNPHSSAAWRRACPFNYEVLETGYPRNDIFFQATEARTSEIKRKLGVPENKQVALYAPTVRNSQIGTPHSVPLDIFDANKVATALGADWVLLTRSHYFLKPAGTESGSSIIDVSSYQNSNEIALISDLLITDYSSLMFDYACLHRPIILYQYDYDHYAQQRGLYFDISETPPGPIIKTQPELIETLQSKGFKSQESQENITRFAEIFAPWDDGHATDRVLQNLFHE